MSPYSTQRLISKLQRRLRKRQEQQAQYGIDTPPHVSTEIEDIKKRINELKRGKDELERETQFAVLVDDVQDEYPELRRVLNTIELNRSKAYRTADDLELSMTADDSERRDFEEKRLESFVRNIHIHILFALEAVVNSSSLLEYYKRGFAEYETKLSKIEMAPYVDVALPVTLIYMEPYIELIGSLASAKSETTDEGLNNDSTKEEEIPEEMNGAEKLNG